MSVVSMQKVRLLVYKTDIDATLNIIQRSGALEFRETDLSDISAPKIESPNVALLARVQHANNFLIPYAKKVGLWQTLREGSHVELKESEVVKQLNDTEAIAQVVDDLERLQVEFAEANAKVRDLEDRHEELLEWKNLPIKLADLETNFTVTKLLRAKKVNEKGDIAEELKAALKETDIAFKITRVSKGSVALTVTKEPEVLIRLTEIFSQVDLEIVVAPEGVETPDVEIISVEESLAKAKGELALLHDQAEHFAQTHLKRLQISNEVLSWQHERLTSAESAVATKQTIIFDGWLDQSKRDKIEATIAEQNLAAFITDLEVAEDEEPPVEIHNSYLVQPFEMVTRLYGMPGYKDLDPTVFLAGFFFLFFGLSLTDVGYGMFLMVVALIVLTLFKVTNMIKVFARLLFFMGLASFLVGLLFGGYLGIDPESLPPVLRAIQLFDPIGNPLPVFYMALGLGVFQIMVGMVLKIVSFAKNGKFVEGLLDQGPWLVMFLIIIAYVATVTGYLSVLLPEQLVNLMYVGIIAIVLSSGRKGKTVGEKIQKSALSLYDSIGYFSDILSYSRLLALGLATTALAFAVNLIADIVRESVPYVGVVLAVAVLIIGHLFTLAVNTLGAFIHSARLQFVEFFGKFIAGTGKEFKPLSRSQKYITVTDD